MISGVVGAAGVVALLLAALHPENVMENDFLFFAIGPTVVPASATVIGASATVKSALLPPLIVQVVSVIIPLKEITPPDTLVAATDCAHAIAADTAASVLMYCFISFPMMLNNFNIR